VKPELAQVPEVPPPPARPDRPPVEEDVVAFPLVAEEAELDEAERLELQSLVEAIQAQMRPCWRQAGRAGRAQPVVALDVSLNRNGSIRNTIVADRTPLGGDTGLRTMAKGAQAAVLQCSPFKLPNNQYALWRELTLVFHQN